MNIQDITYDWFRKMMTEQDFIFNDMDEVIGKQGFLLLDYFNDNDYTKMCQKLPHGSYESDYTQIHKLRVISSILLYHCLSIKFSEGETYVHFDFNNFNSQNVPSEFNFIPDEAQTIFNDLPVGRNARIKSLDRMDLITEYNLPEGIPDLRIYNNYEAMFFNNLEDIAVIYTPDITKLINRIEQLIEE